MSQSLQTDSEKDYRRMLRTVSATDKELRRIYEQAAQELRDKADAANDKSLTKRWQRDMSQSLHDRLRQLGNDTNHLITSSAAATAQLPTATTSAWLDKVMEATGRKGTNDSFRSTLSRTSDEALRQVINGRAYLDGKSLSQRIWSRTARQEEGINNVLKQGIAQKKSARELAKDLYGCLSPKVKDTPDASYYAQRLARTSINHAYALANREAQARNPFCTAMHWQLSSRHSAQMTDICDEYATHDEGLGTGNWPVKETPLGHACCLCCQYPVVPQSLDACAKELKDWLDGGENSRLDAAFGGWKAEREQLQKDQAPTFLANDKTAEQRAELLRQVAQRSDVQAMSNLERQRYFDTLIDSSTADLMGYHREGYDRGIPMDAVQRDRIIANLRKKGADIMMDDESENYLNWRENTLDEKIDACTLGDTVMFRKSPTASDVFEEAIHLHQQRTQTPDPSWSTDEIICRREIEAAQILLKNGEKYGIPKEETSQTAQRLAAEKARLESIHGKERGY